MDQNTLAELKKQLEERKIRIMQQLEGVGDKVQGSDDYDPKFPNYGDSMEDSVQEVADYSKNLSLEKDLESELRSIEKALVRIDEGEYGTCTHCGKEIELERLRIRPESNSCVACKNALKNKNGV